MTASPKIRVKDFDPDEYRMTVGEHLEELRRRLIYGLLGFAVALVFCLIYGRRVVAAFCAPLYESLQDRGLNPQLFLTDLADGFMVFLKISVICAIAIASPWLLYQLWQFVAAGLYPNERRWVQLIMPFSIALLLAGMAFVYWLVLPMTLIFFIDFSVDFPLPTPYRPEAAATVDLVGTPVNALPGDPATLTEGQPMVWFNTQESRLKFFTGHEGDVRVIPFGPSNLLGFTLTLPTYISLVLSMLLIFGLCFQLPLVVMTIARLGLVDLAVLRGARRYVYFIMAIIATVITPGDVITVTIALMVPLILLYELGLWLAIWGRGRSEASAE